MIRFELNTKQNNVVFWNEIESSYPEIFQKALTFRAIRFKGEFNKSGFSTKWLFDFFIESGINIYCIERRSIEPEHKNMVMYHPFVSEQSVEYLNENQVTDLFIMEMKSGWGRIDCNKTILNSHRLIWKKHLSDRILIELCFKKYNAIHD